MPFFVIKLLVSIFSNPELEPCNLLNICTSFEFVEYFVMMNFFFLFKFKLTHTLTVNVSVYVCEGERG